MFELKIKNFDHCANPSSGFKMMIQVYYFLVPINYRLNMPAKNSI